MRRIQYAQAVIARPGYMPVWQREEDGACILALARVPCRLCGSMGIARFVV